MFSSERGEFVYIVTFYWCLVKSERGEFVYIVTFYWCLVQREENLFTLLHFIGV